MVSMTEFSEDPPEGIYSNPGESVEAPELKAIRKQVWEEKHRPYLRVGEKPDPVRQVIIDLENILVKKGQDYASHGDTFINFRNASAFAGIEVEEGMLYRIGEKLERLESLRACTDAPNFESIEDTYLDLAGYFILLVAYSRSQHAESV